MLAVWQTLTAPLATFATLHLGCAFSVFKIVTVLMVSCASLPKEFAVRLVKPTLTVHLSRSATSIRLLPLAPLRNAITMTNATVTFAIMAFAKFLTQLLLNHAPLIMTVLDHLMVLHA